MIGRIVVGLAGTLTLVVLFRIGRRVAGDIAGLLAALLLAVAILHVRESHFAMTDVVMTLLLMVSLAALLRGLDAEAEMLAGRRYHMRWFAIAGLAGGLATSTKYTAAVVVAAMAVAQLQLLARHRRSRSQSWAASFVPAAAFAVAFVAGFFGATPYALIDSARFVEDFQFNVSHLAQGHVVDLGRGWTYHLRRSLPYGAGLTTSLAALAGVVPLARRHPGHGLVLGSFALALYVAIGNGHTVFFRYVLPLVPIVCLVAAVGIEHAGGWLASRSSVSPGLAIGILTALVALPAAVNCAWFDVLLARTDTRVLAARWIVEHAQPEQTLVEAPDPYTELDLGGRRLHVWPMEAITDSISGAEGRMPDWLVLHESPLWTYARIPPGLRSLAAARYELAQTVRATSGPARSAVYDLQDAFFMPVSRFGTVERPGPTVLIYRRVK